MFKTLITFSAIALSLATFAWAEAPTAFDVAEDHTRIFMSAQPVHENGMPAHGNAFVSQGYIYPEGTLADGTVGVLEDGSPAFPDLVLGTWTCDGYFVGEGGNATTGVWIISRQTFAFKDGATLVTQGTEIADIGQPNLRPVTGATGDFADIDGGLIQTTLGFNDFWGLSATYAFEAPEMDEAKAQDATYLSSGDQPMPVHEGDHLEWDSGAPVGPIFEEHMIPST
ncbi:hypothetical protein J7394_21900 [Ruegeria sp. R13_0]|uniref:hypothetical protein n=1 Tax=Ruegeria sp. R13_0 TaxID=2821099 RepID=UPI001ADCFEED|nr:hypothetical protein [Ruegeria sp. R13_0]MBO9436869.1 hypothetical protein [Ruegeria sp. R13_0]